MPKYKCTVTVSVTTVKEVTEVIEIDAPDEVTAEEDARTAAELIDEDTWDTNPNQSDSYIEGFDVGIGTVVSKAQIEKAKNIGNKGFELIAEKFSNEQGLAALKKIFND